MSRKTGIQHQINKYMKAKVNKKIAESLRTSELEKPKPNYEPTVTFWGGESVLKRIEEELKKIS